MCGRQVVFFWNSALYLNAILKFNLIIALLVAEHILSSTVALTNYLQKRDIDLLEVVKQWLSNVFLITDSKSCI
jgi:hypothetical protein